jgi:Metallo-peptidase family M12B Reprolysin-like
MKRVVLVLLLLQLASNGCDQWPSRGASHVPERTDTAQASQPAPKGDEYTQLFVELPGGFAPKGCQPQDYSFASAVQCFLLSTGDLKKILLIDEVKPGGRVRLFPATGFGDELFTAKDRATPGEPNSPTSDYRWLGSVYSSLQSQKKIGTAMLSLRQGRIVARITATNDVYEVRPLGNGVHAVIKVDRKKSLPLHPPGYQSGKKKARYGGPSPWTHLDSWNRSWQESLGGLIKMANAAPECVLSSMPLPDDRRLMPNISVAVGFEQSAVGPLDDIVDLGTAYIGFIQTALETSRIALSVALPTTDGIQTIENFVVGDQSLDALVNGTERSPGAIGTIHQWRKSVRADLVLILTKNVGWCGLSAQVKPDEAKYGFAFVHPQCANVELQVAHEVGHLLGGDHEPTATDHSPRSDFDARARILDLEGFDRKTIMCETNSIPEPYFSNPDVCWDLDHPTGILLEENNARAMSAQAGVVSQFSP